MKNKSELSFQIVSQIPLNLESKWNFAGNAERSYITILIKDERIV